MTHFTEMVEWVLPQVVAVNRAVTRPVIEKKTGLRMLSTGSDFGQIVTHVDVGVSNALLDGGVPNVEGLRTRYSGSFSEEKDSPKRVSSLVIYQVDPIDGTGDFQKTYNTQQVMPPTTLVTKLSRKSVTDPFVPVAGMIFEILNEYAIVGDGTRTGLFVAGKNVVNEVPIRKASPRSTGLPLRVNRRFSYPQDVYDNKFPQFLKEHSCDIQQVAVGGAGMQMLHFLRHIFEPADSGAGAFLSLDPIDVIFNCQPDWKTWDTDPGKVITSAWDCVFYEHIKEQFDAVVPNAAAEKLSDMLHRGGCRFGDKSEKLQILTQHASRFESLGYDLLSKNY
ncbi:MAG: hypothetical protein RI935_732 [Candidatus Parcubacteria bacterium]|jgi:hypothetical protein